MPTSIRQQLSGLLGSDSVLPEDQLDAYAIDGVIPKAVARPGGRPQVVQVMRWASEEGVTVFSKGGGTQLSLGNVPGRVDLVVDLSRCDRVVDFQPSDLTATVEAGVTLDSLQQRLAEGGKFLALEAPLSARATIGGILAANVTGPLRFAYGPPRDWLIGIETVSPQGVETKAGGKVVKNVTGYDLDKLYTGSLGTLGIFLEATFKLSPLPPESSALVAVFPSVQSAVHCGGQLLRRVYAPQGLEVLDQSMAQRLSLALNRDGPGAFGAGRLPELQDLESMSLAFFTGRSRTVRRKLNESAQLLRDSGASKVEQFDGQQAAALLRSLTDLGWQQEDLPYLGLKVSVPPSTVAQVAAWFEQSSSGAEHGLIVQGPSDVPPGIVADPGFGMVRFLWWTDTPTSENGQPVTSSVEQGWLGRLDDPHLAATIARVRELARELGGSVVVERAPLTVKRRIDVWGESPAGIDIMQRIKQKFDPSGILNPGRFVGGI